MELDNFIYRLNLSTFLLNCTATLKIFDPFTGYLDVICPLDFLISNFSFHSVILSVFRTGGPQPTSEFVLRALDFGW